VEVSEQVVPKEGIDFIETGDGVVYFTTLMSGLTKSGVNKLISNKIYKQLTMRNYNTTKKILEKLYI
jgi:uncharacterized protein (DUF1697 family)